MPRFAIKIAWGFAVVVGTAAVGVLFGHRDPLPSRINASPSSRPVTLTNRSASRPAPPHLTTYLSALHESDPRVAIDHLLDAPVPLEDAARLQLSGPIYLDPAGHLWITRANASPLSLTLSQGVDGGPTLLRESPVYVHWANDAAGNWSPCVVCRSNTGGYDFTRASGVHHWAGPADCDWPRSFSFGDRIVVPTSTGVTVLDIDATGSISAHAKSLPGLTSGSNPPIAMLDSRGVLAWSPCENDRPGSGGAIRFVDGTWSAVDEGAHLVQMVPLLDGSVLTLNRDRPGHVALAIEPLDSTELDRKHLMDLIDKLSDDDPDVRDSAYAELSRYGPGLWPVLEQSLDSQPPEAKLRVQRLLKGKIAPALGGMALIDGNLDTVHRQPDGTAIFFAPGGVELPGVAAEPVRVIPAWIVLRPGGRFGRPLVPELVADQSLEHFTLISVGDDWYICDAAGPRRFLGNQWVKLLHADESAFDRMIGQDGQGRWLFASSSANDRFLILDPTVLDPTPRLPVWSIRVEGHTGVDRQGWPTITHDKGSWALHETGWLPTDEGQPAPVVQNDSALLVCADGTRYLDGQTSLVMIPPHGGRVTWPLPGTAVGSVPAALIRTDDGVLFLFNAPGRILRIRATPAGPEPFVLDATFTHDIPNVRRYDRLWIDPAGRIACAFDGNQLAVMFPAGHMPVELSQMQLKTGP